MSRFYPSRRPALLDVAAAVAVAALSIAAYVSMPGGGEAFAVFAKGTVESVDPSMRVIRISHDPVKALNAQSMRMDFGFAPGLDLRSLRVGAKVAFTLTRREDDLYVVDARRPMM